MGIQMKEISAHNAEGILIWDPISKRVLFRKYNPDYTFVDYQLTHPDLCVKIIDDDAAFYSDNDKHYLDISSAGMKVSDNG